MEGFLFEFLKWLVVLELKIPLLISVIFVVIVLWRAGSYKWLKENDSNKHRIDYISVRKQLESDHWSDSYVNLLDSFLNGITRLIGDQQRFPARKSRTNNGSADSVSLLQALNVQAYEFCLKLAFI